MNNPWLLRTSEVAEGLVDLLRMRDCLLSASVRLCLPH